ncbi:MAG TPA: polysaccharide biosynthesis/export family protein [Terriglobales bacterium]|nr:polysaccharide biosynthesis/export family protein [Terriglobales bacterium]
MWRRSHIWIVVALCSAALPVSVRGAARQSTQTNAQTSQPASAQSTPQGTTPQAATQDPNYIIGPQDVLDISVWKEPDLTRSLPVRPDGKISIPLLSDVQAAGLTPTQLASKITTELQKFVTNPQVTVIVTQINSQRIYILGEVGRAGAYPLLPGMTVLQALSSAGGLSEFANGKKIYVMRQVNGKQDRYPFNYKEVLSGKKADENIQLKAGDTIVVP